MNRASGQTLRIAALLAWEFWASGWRVMLLAPFGVIALLSFIFTAIVLQTGVHSLRGPATALQFGFYWVSVVFLAVSVLHAVGKPRLRYTLPASGFLLVATPMACAMLTVFLQYSIAIVFLNAVFDAGWSIVGPALLAAVFVAWLQAMLWSAWNSPGLQVLACATSFAALILAITVYPRMINFSKGVDEWQLTAFCLAALSSVGVGAGGFAKLRHGSEIDVKRLVDWWNERTSFRRTARALPFSRPRSAQFWLEWKRGQVLPIGFLAIGIAASLLAWSLPAIAGFKHNGDNFIIRVNAVFVLLLGTIWLYWGMRSPRGEIGAFEASRPLSDAQLANAILKSATLAFIATLAVWLVSMATVVGILGNRPEVSMGLVGVWQIRAVASDMVALSAVALGAVMTWSVVSAMMCLMLTGTRYFSVAFGLAWGVALVGVLLPLCYQPGSRREIGLAYWSICLAVGLFGCGATFLASWRRSLISKQTLWLAAMLVLVSGSTAIALSQFARFPFDSRYLPLLLGCCGLTPLPLAAAPLAVYVNRHR